MLPKLLLMQENWIQTQSVFPSGGKESSNWASWLIHSSSISRKKIQGSHIFRAPSGITGPSVGSRGDPVPGGFSPIAWGINNRYTKQIGVSAKRCSGNQESTVNSAGDGERA